MTEIKKPLIIDTDPGIDDAASIFWVLASGKFDVKALTVTHGNVGLEGCAKNALRIIDAAGYPEIPVYKGASKPLMRNRISAEFAHGDDGMGNSELPLSSLEVSEGHAAVKIVEIAKASKEPVTILAIGPITNVALAVLLEPDLKKYVDKVIFMGGAVNVPGNMTPAASFNVFSDPEAARIVYRSGIHVVQAGLDVCNRYHFYPRHFDELGKSDNRIAEFVCQMVRFRLNQLGTSRRESVARNDNIALNDVAATSFLMNPEWFSYKDVPGDIATEGDMAGYTLLDFENRENKECNVTFLYDVDSETAISQWMHDISNPVR